MSQTVQQAGVNPTASDAAEVARSLDVDPAQGLTAGEAASRLASHGAEPAGRRQEGAGLARLPAPVRGLHAGGAPGRGRRQPGGHRRDRHHGRAGRADRVQRGRRSAPGGEGRGERQGAGADDEDDRPGTSRRPGGRDRRRGAGARRRGAGRGRQPGARRRPGGPGRDAGDRGGGADRREPAGRQVDRPGAGRGRPAGRPDLHGVHEHLGHPRPWRADRHRHGHGHRDRPHRRHAGQHRDQQDPAAEAAGRAVQDHRLDRGRRAGDRRAAGPGPGRVLRHPVRHRRRARRGGDPDRACRRW